ncbi:MAG: manganese-binding transcriptional regulator MntR [Planctomycetaceae bacterium]|nr:manganese-binding transcriptional regulator MntR [Planctomycetaceae bacterium]
MADMESAKNSAPHRRTRNDHKSETAEDYVEAIAEILAEQPVCRLADLAKRFAVSNVTAHRIVERLLSEGLVATEPYQPISLTPEGRRLAARCRERHEVVYRFLLAIGIDEQTAALDAEGIEHHVSPRTLKRFKELTGQLAQRNAADDSESPAPRTTPKK